MNFEYQMMKYDWKFAFSFRNWHSDLRISQLPTAHSKLPTAFAASGT